MKRLIRARQQPDGGFAMMYALLIILIVTSVVGVISALVAGQVRPTQYAKKYIRTVNGAQAGLQNTLTALRDASSVVNGQSGGDPTKLPCSEPSDSAQYGGGGVTLYVDNGNGTSTTVNLPGDPVSGTVANDGNSNDAISYQVAVVYFTVNPETQQGNAAWLTANALHCAGGYVDKVPAYALVQSSGTGVTIPGAPATSGNRTLQAIYQFGQTTSFTVGGRLAEYSTPQFQMCLDAGSNPAAGTVPTMQPCQAFGYAQQTWEYRNDLTIFYGGNTSLNLCLWNMSGSPKLEPCYGDGSGSGTDSTYPYHTSGSQNQQNEEWGFNDNGHLSVALSTGDVNEGASGSCLQPSSSDTTMAVTGAAVLITTCSSNTTGDTAWNPDPQVGAGSALVYYNASAVPAEIPPTGVPASSPSNQFVNFAEFGRCLDVTGQNQNADHLIDYPCKQAPNFCMLTWNQVWYYQTISGNYGIFYTDYASGRHACDAAGTNYCLTEPASPATYITITPCDPSYPANQMWDATGAQPTYSASYLVKSYLDGRCMGADPSNQITYGSSTIVATACDGSGVPSGSAVSNPLLLKWNAPPATPAHGLEDVHDAGSTVTQSY